jgi:predicted aconitase with swiveling domain
VLNTRILFAGAAEGELAVLEAPLSFWGGVDPATGRIIAPQHPQCGLLIGKRLLALPEMIGSSSSSSVLLELIRRGHAPSGIVMGDADAILIVGCIVARELGYQAPPVVALHPKTIASLTRGRYRLATDGVLTYLAPIGP